MVIAKTMQMGPLLCLLERNENSQLHAKSFDIQIRHFCTIAPPIVIGEILVG